MTAGQTATITVTRTGGSDGTVTVAYTTQHDTAVAGADYTTASGTLTFGPGVTSQTFTVATLVDPGVSGHVSLDVVLGGTTGGASLDTSDVLSLSITGSSPTPTTPAPTPTTPWPTPTTPWPTPTTPWPTPTTPWPTPTPITPTPTPASPASIPTQSVVVGEQPLFERRLNKKGKPTGKAVLTGFTLDLGEALSASAANSANYQVATVMPRKVRGKKVTTLRPFANFTVSYLASSDAVQITLGSRQTFPSGGQITILAGLTTASGAALTGPAVFTIASGGKSIVAS